VGVVLLLHVACGVCVERVRSTVARARQTDSVGYANCRPSLSEAFVSLWSPNVVVMIALLHGATLHAARPATPGFD
jgi:hypothetical protein